MERLPTVAERSVLRARPGLGWYSKIWHFIVSRPLGGTGVIILAVACFVALAAPVIAPYDPFDQSAELRLNSPSLLHPFGTGVLGRDVLSRTIYGARVSIYVGLLGMTLSSLAGAILGITSAYYGGKYDLILQRFVDVLSAFPSLLLAITIMAVLGQSLNNVVIAITVVLCYRAIRTIRSQALSVKETDYVLAARALGSSNARIMLRHILPNTFGPFLVISSASLGSVIVIEASLSFLGVGTPTSVISWGSMLSGDNATYFASAPWIAIFPGLALTLVVFAINVLGDSLRDVLDPKLRGR